MSEYFKDEEGWQESVPDGLPEWFDDLGDHVASLPLDDARLVDAATYMRPLFDNDPDLVAYAMYPEGNAADYLDSWGGSADEFFSGFVGAMAEDYVTWTEGGFRPSSGVVASTRELLAGLFASEKGWQDSVPAGLPEWFDALGAHVTSLPLEDPRLVDAASYMGPLFQADPDLDGCLLYPGGQTFDYSAEWGGDVDAYFSGFLAALTEDYATWAEGGFRPDVENVGVMREHFSSLFAKRQGAVALRWPKRVPRGLNDWFLALGEHVASLPLDDPLLIDATRYFVPFVANDVDLQGCGMYPGGEAADYLNSWGGDPSEFFSGFVAALRDDYVTWSDGPRT